ncbi:hypothetical protein TSEDIMI_300005 [Tenacibaculum sediminilitoris]
MERLLFVRNNLTVISTAGRNLTHGSYKHFRKHPTRDLKISHFRYTPVRNDVDVVISTAGRNLIH